MANKERGEIDVKIGDKEFTLTPTFELAAQIEDRFNCGIAQLYQRFSGTDWRLTEMVDFLHLVIGKKNVGKTELQRGVFGQSVELRLVVIAFLMNLLTGGRPVSEVLGDDDESEEPEGNDKALMPSES